NAEAPNQVRALEAINLNGNGLHILGLQGEGHGIVLRYVKDGLSFKSRIVFEAYERFTGNKLRPLALGVLRCRARKGTTCPGARAPSPALSAQRKDFVS